MKLCFSTLGCVNKSLDEIISLANEFSAEGVEIRGIGGVVPNGEIKELSEECAQATKDKLRACGLSAVSLGTSCMFHTEEKYNAALKEGKEAILIAKRMGIPYIRVFGNNITENRDECIERVGKGIAELCAFAEGTGVTVLLEVHGDFNTVEALSPILARLGECKTFGLIWDIYHSHKPYGDRWEEFYNVIKPYIRHVHIKDFSDKKEALVLPGKGDIPIVPIMKKLIADGYDGYFSLEWERQWHPELDELEVAMDHFVRLVREI